MRIFCALLDHYLWIIWGLFDDKIIPAGKLLISGSQGGVFAQSKNMVQSVPVINISYLLMTRLLMRLTNIFLMSSSVVLSWPGGGRYTSQNARSWPIFVLILDLYKMIITTINNYNYVLPKMRIGGVEILVGDPYKMFTDSWKDVLVYLGVQDLPLLLVPFLVNLGFVIKFSLNW